MKFDPDMPYITTLKHTARGLVQWPVGSEEFEDFCEAARTVLYALLCWTVRPLLLITLPVSAPILALILHAIRKSKAKPRSSQQPADQAQGGSDDRS